MHAPSLPTAKHHGVRRTEQTDRHVLLLCPTLFGIRNVVHSDLLPELAAHGLAARVLGREAGVGHPRVEALRRPVGTGRGWQRALSGLVVLQRASFFRRHRLSSDRVSLWWYRRSMPAWRRLQLGAVESLGAVGRLAPLYQWQTAGAAQLRRRAWDLKPYRDLLRAERPALVIATSCIDVLEDPYLYAARDLGIPTLGCIQSFDHVTGRSLIAECDDYAVWNPRMRDQLLQYHRVRGPSHVHITGTPQFDFHARAEFRWSRSATLQELGVPEGGKYVLYAANTSFQAPSEPRLVEAFVKRCAAHPVLARHYIVVRLHPLDDFGRWRGLGALSSQLVLSHPSARPEQFATAGDQSRLVSSVFHADACINMWSSMSLDAAALGTPVVCVAFAGVPATDEDRFCRIAYEADFYRPIVASGGVRVAGDLDTLVHETARYALDRSRDAQARSALAAAECGPVDGRSAQRIARVAAALALAGDRHRVAAGAA